MDFDLLFPKVVAVCLVLYLTIISFSKGAFTQIFEDWCKNYIYRLETTHFRGMTWFCYAICWGLFYLLKSIMLLEIAIIKFFIWDIWNMMFDIDQSEGYLKLKAKLLGKKEVPQYNFEESYEKKEDSTVTVSNEIDDNSDSNIEENISDKANEAIKTQEEYEKFFPVEDKRTNKDAAKGLEKIASSIWKTIKILFGVLNIIAILGGFMEIYQEGVKLETIYVMAVCLLIAWLCFKKKK